MKKIVVTGVLSVLFLVLFIVLCVVEFTPYTRGENYVPYDLMIAIFGMLTLVPAAVLGTAALVMTNKPAPLFIASGVFALLTIPAWFTIRTMSFVMGLPLLICMSCTLCGGLLLKRRTKALFIYSGAIFAVFAIIAAITVIMGGGNIEPQDFAGVYGVFLFPALNSAAFGLSGGLYSLGKPVPLFVAGGVIAASAVFWLILNIELGIVYGIPTILSAAVCIVLAAALKKRTAKS